MKVLFITNYPSPYRVDFFNLWGKMDHVDLNVIFLESPEKQKHRSKKWFHTDYKNFRAIFLKNRIYLGSEKYICTDIFTWLRKKYDGIIFGGYAEPTFMVAMEYLRMHHIPYGIEVDGGLINKDSRFKFIVKRHFLSSADYWFSSGKVASDYLIHYGAKPNKIIRYPFSSMMKMDMENALGTISSNDKSEEDWCKHRQVYRNRARDILKVKEPTMCLLIGQFVKRKGFDLLLDLIPQLDKSVGYYFIGGKVNQNIDCFIKEHNLKNIHILDFKTSQELALYFRAADLMILPTRYDIWGLVIGEAMAYGLPIVTTDLCGAGLELVEEGKNGVLCHAGDKNSLQKAINKIMKMDLNHLGFKSYKKIQAYTIENMALAHYKFYLRKDDA